jgi:hypothetical protein
VTGASVSDSISGLTPGTVYHFRVVATNADGTAAGNDQTFTTPGPPIVTTGGATGVSVNGATLNGTINPTGRATTFKFEYGTTTAYGSQVTGDAGSGSLPVAVSAAVADLAPSTTYHYRLVATNADGTSTGADATFTTAAPAATNGSDSGTGSSSGGTAESPPAPTGSTSVTPRALGLTLAFVPVRLRTLIAKGLRVNAACGEACTVTIKLVISRKDAKRLGLKTTLATVNGKGGTPLRLRLVKKAKRVLARVKSIRVRLVTAAVAPDGRKSTAQSKWVRLRR